MASNLFHPFVGAARAACANLPRPDLPGHPCESYPPRAHTRLTPEHNGRPIFSPSRPPLFQHLNTNVPELRFILLFSIREYNNNKSKSDKYTFGEEEKL